MLKKTLNIIINALYVILQQMLIHLKYFGLYYIYQYRNYSQTNILTLLSFEPYFHFEIKLYF